jgi:hypothetical protein
VNGRGIRQARARRGFEIPLAHQPAGSNDERQMKSTVAEPDDRRCSSQRRTTRRPRARQRANAVQDLVFARATSDGIHLEDEWFVRLRVRARCDREGYEHREAQPRTMERWRHRRLRWIVTSST